MAFVISLVEAQEEGHRTKPFIRVRDCQDIFSHESQASRAAMNFDGELQRNSIA